MERAGYRLRQRMMTLAHLLSFVNKKFLKNDKNQRSFNDLMIFYIPLYSPFLFRIFPTFASFFFIEKHGISYYTIYVESW